MRRVYRATQAIAMICALLFIAAAWLCIDSLWWPASGGVELKTNESLSYHSHAGRFTLTRLTITDRSDPNCGTEATPEAFASTIDQRVRSGQIEVVPVNEPAANQWLTFERRSERVVYPNESIDYRSVAVPYWFILLIAGLPPLLYLLMLRNSKGTAGTDSPV